MEATANFAFGPRKNAGLSRRFRNAALSLILATSFLLKLHHLNHASVKPLDEVFHALVARNFLKHPLMPTLVDQPFLPYDDQNWQEGHLWLHKPPMAMWQIALSFAALGVNTFSLRLPSAVLSTLAAWLTYLIGAELLDATAGLIAAGFQAFNPVILMLVHGYLFSDHVDISLLFWTEASIYFLCRGMRTGSRGDWALSGVAEGLAFLSKTYPALIALGLALLVWLFSKPARKTKDRNLGTFILAATVTVLPWNVYAAIRFPGQFAYENLNILHHLSENVEQWAGPWDRVAFDYWISTFYVFYAAILCGVLIATVRAVQTRKLGLWLILAWAFGAAVPNLLATSKTPSATLIGWPAAWLLLGYLISSAIQKDRWALGVWMISMLLAVVFLTKRSIPNQGWGYDGGGAGSIMLKHLWVIEQFAAALVIGFVLTRLKWRRAMIAIATIATIALFVQPDFLDRPPGYFNVAWRVTRIDREEPDFAAIGQFALRLPSNAAFLVREQSKLENKQIEFATDRSCYSLDQPDWRPDAEALEQAGAIPFLVTSENVGLPVVLSNAATGEQGMKVYACTPAAARFASGQ